MYVSGFPPQAYQTITDFQILKKCGVYEVEKMCTIQLMNAAFNMNNKTTGRQAMAQAERFNLIPWEQTGSRNLGDRPTLRLTKF